MRGVGKELNNHDIIVAVFGISASKSQPCENCNFGKLLFLLVFYSF